MIGQNRGPNGDAPDCSRGITRRQLGKGAAALLALGSVLLAGGGVSLGLSRSPSAVLESLDQAAFEALIGQRLRVSSESIGSVDLDLIGVEGQSQSAGSRSSADQPQVRLVCFTVDFRGPRDRPLGQNTYTLSHRKVGEFPLFIVPSAPSQDGQHYVATINRLV